MLQKSVFNDAVRTSAKHYSLFSGEHYVVGFFKRIDVYCTATASIDFTVPLNGRSNDVVFIDDVTFAISGEMPQVEVILLSIEDSLIGCLFVLYCNVFFYYHLINT